MRRQKKNISLLQRTSILTQDLHEVRDDGSYTVRSSFSSLDWPILRYLGKRSLIIRPFMTGIFRILHVSWWLFSGVAAYLRFLWRKLVKAPFLLDDGVFLVALPSAWLLPISTIPGSFLLFLQSQLLLLRDLGIQCCGDEYRDFLCLFASMCL